jgi:hypothetical protein
LISAGGDDFIALWDYVPGKLLQTLNVKDIIGTKVFIFFERKGLKRILIAFNYI